MEVKQENGMERWMGLGLVALARKRTIQLPAAVA